MADESQNEYVFTWIIENYSACFKAKGEKIRSPVFKIENLFGSRWVLDLYPSGSSNLAENERFVSCFLNWIGSDEYIGGMQIYYRIELLNEKNGVLTVFEYENYVRKNMGYGRDTMIGIYELADEMEEWEEDILIIKCRIRSPHLFEKQKCAGSEACTKNGVDRCSVDWDVKLPMLMEYSESLVFPLTERNQFEVTLVSDMDTVRIYFQFKEEMSDFPMRITIKITVFDIKNCKLKSKRKVYLVKESSRRYFPDFITTEILESCKTDSSLFEFKLVCDVCIWNKSISSHSIIKFETYFASKSIPKAETSLQKQYRNLFVSQLNSDVTFRAGDEEFSAHKFVLKVQSPVFAAMFDLDMLEKQTGVVQIEDMDGDTLKAFLEFVYTETVDKMDYDRAKKLMLAGDKYQLPSLVAECASFLKSNVSVENACEIIMIADLFNCEVLKSYSLNFIKFNADKILPTVAWKQLIERNIKIAELVLSDLSLLIHAKHKFR